MRIRGIFCSIFLLSFFLLSGQNFDKNDFFEADMALVSENFERAARIFEKLLKSDPNNANLNYLYGLCLINIPGRKKETLEYFEKAVASATPDYKYGSHKEVNAPMEAIKYYGIAVKLNNEIPKAIELFNQYKATLDTKEKDELAKADALIESCYTAQKLMAEPVYYRKLELSNNLKSDVSQFYPVVNHDETMLFFTVPGQYNKDEIFFSVKENDEWSKPTKITVHLGVKSKCNPSSISFDNERLYLTVHSGTKTDIYYSTFYKGRWKKMIKLDKPINGKDWDSQAYESSDGKYLYFASDRKGGFGNMDLYRSEKKSDGEWLKPVNLGETVNTTENELMPVINYEQTKLFFKSDAHENAGGYDIFVSDKLGDNEWSNPVNIGYPLSTTDDDIYFMPIDNGFYAYASLQNPAADYKYEINHIEIFSEDHPRIFDISGMVILQDGDGLEGTNIEVYSTDTYQIILSTQPELFTGNYKLEIPAGAYMINYVRPDYKTNTQLIDLPMNNPEGAVVLNAVLEKEAPVVEEVPVVVAETILEEPVSEPPPVSGQESEPEPELPVYEEPEPELPNYEEPEPVYKEPGPVYIPPVTETVETYEETNYTGLYTIQFMASMVKIDLAYLNEKHKVEIQKGADEYYRYVTGAFNSIAEAEVTHQEIASTKYKNAFIRFHNLDDYLNQAASNPSLVYTIQLMALKEDTKPGKLSMPDNIKVSHGDDGWYRYTIGEYMSLADAHHALNDLITKGYKNAYIKKIAEVSNYHK